MREILFGVCSEFGKEEIVETPAPRKANPALILQLFGPCEALAKGVPLSRLCSRKALWLLALLALRAGREVDRDWLAGTLWPESEESKARFNLRQTLAQLRRALGEAASCLQNPSPLTLCLARQEVRSDVDDFDAAIREGTREAREQAIALYRGPLLEGCTEEWVFAERAVREQAYLTALERLASEALAERKPVTAVHYLRLLLAVDSLREESLRALMQALADCGDYAAITQVYRDFRLLLRKELNASPSPETDALYRQLQIQAADPAPVPAPPREPMSLSRRLPVPLTSLIGRAEEIEEVLARLRAGRLTTLIGAGGVGKTRLAIAVGDTLSDDFPDGVWFVELASLTEPQNLAALIAKTLGLSKAPEEEWQETLPNRLTDRALLLILDNCEHILSDCAEWSERLLYACPFLRILTTSREPLGLSGEHLFPVSTLALPPRLPEGAEEKNIHALLEYTAVRLFVERVVQARPGFRLTRANSAAVCRICRQLDGIPLALELAAARARVLSVEEIANRLDDRFQLLTGGRHSALPRHQTLRALIDWSYHLLSPSEQALFRTLSIFAGGWTLEAAEAICADTGKREEVLFLLASLVDKSLVVCEEREGETRYHLLETIRQYSLFRLKEQGEEEAFQRRHGAYFLLFAEAAEQQLYGEEQGVWFARTEAEHENLRAALEGFHADAVAVNEELRLAGALGRFWDTRGYLREGEAYLRRALARTNNQTPALLRAKALMQAGWIAHIQANYTMATTQGEEAIALYRSLEDLDGVSGCLQLLASSARMRGDLETAKRLFTEQLDLNRQLGVVEGSILMYLARIAQAQEEDSQARRLLEEALITCRREGSPIHVAACLNDLALYALRESDWKGASALLTESLSLGYQIGANVPVIHCLERFVMLAAAQKDYARVVRLGAATAALREALGLARPSDSGALTDARSALGEKRYNDLYAEGCHLTLDQAIARALPPFEEADQEG